MKGPNQHSSGTYLISVNELRQLLFWANYGVGNAYTGSYPEIQTTLREWADTIKYRLHKREASFGWCLKQNERRWK